MTLDNTLITTIIAHFISISGIVISFYISRRTLINESKRLERQLQRQFTEKLYEKRLQSYPLAFEITEDITGEYLYSTNISKDVLLDTRKSLLEWNRKNGLILSQKSVQSFYNLKKILKIENDIILTKETLDLIFEAKNQFRSALREDLNLLYIEEQLQIQNP